MLAIGSELAQRYNSPCADAFPHPKFFEDIFQIFRSLSMNQHLESMKYDLNPCETTNVQSVDLAVSDSTSAMVLSSRYNQANIVEHEQPKGVSHTREIITGQKGRTAVCTYIRYGHRQPIPPGENKRNITQLVCTKV